MLVTPWLGSAVPFFALETMRLLADAGENVCVIYDACDVIGNAYVKTCVLSRSKRHDLYQSVGW